MENENTYLRAILSWVSSSEPQLGMMMKQFKHGDGFGVDYTYTKSDFDKLYGKIGNAVGVPSALNTASTSTQPSLVDLVDDVLKEPPKAPPQKQVWVPKPNELSPGYPEEERGCSFPSKGGASTSQERGEVPLRVLSQRWSHGGVLLQEKAGYEA